MTVHEPDEQFPLFGLPIQQQHKHSRRGFAVNNAQVIGLRHGHFLL
jgi:hypothetical protein